LTQVLDYTAYEAQPLPARVDWFDQLKWEDIAQPSQQKIIKNFLSQVYENDPSKYLKKKAIEWFSELSLGNVLRLTAAKEFLLDVAEEETFIKIAKVKYLFLLFGDDEDVWQELNEAASSDDAEVSSEAYYRQGLIHLLYRTGQVTEAAFFAELQQATKLFNQAVAEVGEEEDRIDARFFGLVTQYLIELLAEQKVAYEATLHQLDDILWQRQLWSRRPVTELFEWHVYRGLFNMQAIAEHTAHERSWGNFTKEFSRLARHFNDMVAATSISRQLQQSYQQFTSGIGEKIVKQYYIKNLSACKERLDTVIADEDSSSELYVFLLSVRDSIQAQQQKKNTEPNFLRLASVLRYYPQIPAEKVNADFQSLKAEGKSEEEAVLELVFTYSSLKPEGDNGFITGYSVGDEVFDRLIKELRIELPDYPSRKWAMFSDILSDIIRYAYQTALLPKEFFPHMHTEKPTYEAVFHRDFFRGLSYGPRATYYHHETSDRIGGGRIDITYQRDGLVYPIEVKRKESKVTWGKINKDYLAQAQSYTVVHEQIGFLVVFDLKTEAVRQDFRNYFRVLHRPSPDGIEDTYKNYVVGIIIPANNASPSASTNY
jgi:hypothetical protein